MTDLHHALEHLEHRLREIAERVERAIASKEEHEQRLGRYVLAGLERLERADRRSEIRDRNAEIRLERLELLEGNVVELLRDILREIDHPRTFPATTSISVRPDPGGG